MTVTTVVFYVFAIWAIASALLCITRASALSAALWLVSTMFSLAVLFVILQAQFIAAVQVLLYAGAVMVLFLFVIMLLNLDVIPPVMKRWPVSVVGIALAAVLGATLVSLHGYTPTRLAREISSLPGVPDPRLVFADGGSLAESVRQQGAVGSIAQPLFEAYLIPFEITSVLLLVAVIGAVVLAKKKL
jgi:NADH-quinone oxidoreductase subunit J